MRVIISHDSLVLSLLLKLFCSSVISLFFWKCVLWTSKIYVFFRLISVLVTFTEACITLSPFHHNRIHAKQLFRDKYEKWGSIAFLTPDVPGPHTPHLNCVVLQSAELATQKVPYPPRKKWICSWVKVQDANEATAKHKISYCKPELQWQRQPRTNLFRSRFKSEII